MENQELQLSQLTDNDRYKSYQLIVDGCAHLWSKNKLQEDKLKKILDIFIGLADTDPLFLAHFTSYAATKLESKDLKVVSIFINSLSDADGTPFIVGRGEDGKIQYSTKYKKPNLRLISQAALQGLDSKQVNRVLELANVKQSLGTRYKEGTHLTKGLKTAIKKYLKFRESNLKSIEGVKKVGLGNVYKNLYRGIHIAPSREAAEILRWQQKKGEKIVKREGINFKGLTDLQIAEKIRNEQISPLVALGALPDKISPVIAVAVLEQASGDQAVILRAQFDSQGILKDKEVLKVFEEKIKTAKTALDRVEKINTEIDSDVEKIMKAAKADKRKDTVGDIGKIFLHIDISGSMYQAIEFAKERGAIIAECVKNPEKNFFWGTFNSIGYLLNKPASFEKDAFMAALYGIQANGGTESLACYEKARELGCDVDIYVTDQGHNGAPIEITVQRVAQRYSVKPKAVVIVDFSGAGMRGALAIGFQNAGIPVSIIKPDTLTESALVAQAVKTAIVGGNAVVDEIMNTPLLKLPYWWYTKF